MATNRENLKGYFNAGDKPTENQFAELIDNTVNKIDDKANLTEAADSNNNEKYITPKTAKKAIETHLPDATFSTAGIVKRASILDAEQGIDINAYVTPIGAKKAAETFAPVKSVNGLQGEIIIASSKANWIDFSGRYTFFTDNRWVGTVPAYGQSSENHSGSYGVSTNPSVLWYTLGIGFLPEGTVIHSLEFIGRVNNAEVNDILVHLSCQGNNLNEGIGYFSNATAQNVVILPPTNLVSHAPNFTHLQRHVVSLNDFVLDRDRIIDFCCKPVGVLTTTRYWSVQCRLHFTLP